MYLDFFTKRDVCEKYSDVFSIITVKSLNRVYDTNQHVIKNKNITTRVTRTDTSSATRKMYVIKMLIDAINLYLDDY